MNLNLQCSQEAGKPFRYSAVERRPQDSPGCIQYSLLFPAEEQQRWADKTQHHADFLHWKAFMMMEERKLIKGWANILLASLWRQSMC